MRIAAMALNFGAPRIWLALLAVPILALLYQTLAYAVVPPSCAAQTVRALHALSIAALLACLAATLLAAHEWRRLRGEPQADATVDSDAAAPAVRRGFMAATAAGVGLLFTLVVGTQWFAAWVLSPCLQ
jgi:hypothetical protein